MSVDPLPSGDNKTQAVVWHGAERWIAFFEGKPLTQTFGTQLSALDMVAQLERLSTDARAAFLATSRVRIADEEEGLLDGRYLQGWRVFSLGENCWLLVAPSGAVIEELYDSKEVVEAGLESVLALDPQTPSGP